ncbi:hypothetical protein EIP91_009820 [Steccherinum ochraceum]|uniref:Zn(2)-C6 fungal-type domain-containing protein n=1 Tax=Steccherinum ochraceum TaxID=92696 RepID=A0A4R0R185_9APHY|nr:hypothetical protein EIP91_009820 [Steccherinum ochraceum]
MSAPTYGMNSGWNPQPVPPQLEHEFLEHPNNVLASDQHYLAAQGLPSSQQSTFPPFGPSSYSARTPQDFTFQQPQSMNRMYGDGAYFDQAAATTIRDPTQGSGQYGTVPGAAFASGPSTSFQESPGGLTSGDLRNQQAGYGYNEQRAHHDMATLRAGGVPLAGATDPTGATAVNPGLYVPSPPHAQFPHHRTYSGSPSGPEFDLPQQPNGQQGFFPDHFETKPDHFGLPANKRQRSDDIQDDISQEQESESKEPAKAKPLGACARCKGLKVRCEFKTDPDTCKRCLAGGHECIIPGRKKRRAPPKREHLLKQIQDQASRIQELMGQLETANKKVNANQPHTPGMPSPTLSSSTDLFSAASAPTTSDFASSDAADVGNDLISDQMSKSSDVMDWIAKARESLQQFGGYINMGETGQTRPLEEPSEQYDSVLSDDESFEFAVEGVDGEDLEVDGETVAEYSGDEGTTRRHRRNGSNTASEVSVRRGSAVGKLPTDEATPFGLMAKLSLMTRKRRPSRPSSEAGDEERGPQVGVPSDDYFKPPPDPERPIIDERQQHPHIFRNGVVRPDEVEALFKIYWDYMNMSTNIHDPELYTPQATYWRSPFLFTVICAVASRFYTPRPELYQQAMHYARLAAGTALIGGRLNVESVQAYTLLMLYPVPCRRWEEDRTWIYLGLAIRIAVSLNLDKPSTAKPKNEQHARELLNRTRTWLAIFNLDRSTGSQYGKPPIITNTDYVAVHSGEWWNSSAYNMKGFDIHVAAYNAELRVIADFGAKIRSNANNPAGMGFNVAQLASETDDKLAHLWESWIALIRQHDPKDAQSTFRNGLLRLAYSYARLSALSFGFQYDFAKKPEGNDFLLWRCLRAAKDVLHAYLDEIATPSQKVFVRHGPDAQSVFVTFASTFLIKLLQPKYAAYLTREQRVEIRDMIGGVINVMEEIAVDDRHCPKLYSKFLAGLLATPMASVDHKSSPKATKAKSASPTSKRVELHNINLPGRGTASGPPSARPSASPPPFPMDQNGQVITGDDHAQQHMSPLTNENMGYNNYFTPLPLEPEFLQSMQALTDQAGGWPDMIMPGFNWMQPHDTEMDMSSLSMPMNGAAPMNGSV